MITLTLDFREVLWWLQGGMSGSHLRWSVYEDMVNRVWPQCTEQERRNLHYIMRRDLGSYWRPDGFNGYDPALKGEGPWRANNDEGYGIDPNDPSGKPKKMIHDTTPWLYFRQVLARFDPDQQFAVTLTVPDSDTLEASLRPLSPASIINSPTDDDLRRYKAGKWPKNRQLTLTVRAYRWQQDYRIDWSHRIDPATIVRAEQLVIPDTGEM